MPRTSIHSYMGDARGHWEGDTLVVETTNFLEKSAYRRRVGPAEDDRAVQAGRARTVEWSVTFDDPQTWARPWTFAMQLTHDETQPRLRVRVPRGQRRAAGHPER